MTAILSQQNEWSCTWPALEKYRTFGTTGTPFDTQRTPYTYFVEEEMTGYTTTISTSNGAENLVATITNKRKPGLDTSISVEKKWKWDDGTDVEDQDPAGDLLPAVTLELYRSALAQASEGRLLPDDAELVDTAQVSKNSQWRHTWENLDKYVNNDDTAGRLYYYYVIEKKPGQSGYTFTTSQNGQGDNAAPQNNPVTVTNTLPYTQITVDKEWLGMDGTVKGTGIPLTVQVRLYRKGTHGGETDQPYGTSVTLIEKTGWSYTWEHLLQGTYYVKEEPAVQGFQASYQADDAKAAMAKPSDVAVSSGKVTVINQEVPVEITVTKDWYGVTPQEVTMQLYRSTEKPPNNTNGQGVLAPEDAEPVEGQTITLDGSTVALNRNAAEGTSGGNGWTYTWTNLPAVNESGDPYYYYVKELIDESQTVNWITVYSYIFRDDGSISHVKVTNGTSETTDIVAEKKWEDVNGQEKTLSDWKVELQLYREKADGSWEPYDPNGTGCKEIGYMKNPWNIWDVKKAEWIGLPAGRYYVKEVSMEGTGVDPKRYTVTYKANPGAASTGSQGNGNPADTGSSNGQGNENPAEAGTSNGQGNENPAEAGTSNDQGYINPADAAIQNGTIQITNTEGATELAVKKLWSDGPQNHSDETVTMHLYSSTTNPDEAKLQSNAREGNRVDVTWNNGTKQISNVIKGNKAEIRLAYEDWKLSQLKLDGIKLVASNNQEYGCVLIEQNNTKYLQFIVDLTGDEQFALVVSGEEWCRDPIEPNRGLHSITDNSGTEVQFNTLILPDEKTKVAGLSKELSSQTDWSAHWENLPLTNSSGEKLYYYIEEKCISNCTADYEYDKNAEGISKVTVTNSPTSENVEVKVTKHWADTDDHMAEQYTVEVELWQHNPDGKESKVSVPSGSTEDGTSGNTPDTPTDHAICYLNKGNGWCGGWTDLPKLPKGGYYFVKETQVTDAAGAKVSGYIPLYQNNMLTASGTVEITNWAATSISVEKKWLKADGTQKTEGIPNSIEVELYRLENTGYQLFKTISLGSSYSDEEDYDESGWKYTWNSLPQGSYYVKETKIIANNNNNNVDVTSCYTVSYSTDGVTYSEGDQSPIQEKGELYIRNQEAVTELQVKKEWMDSSGNKITDQKGLPSITVNLYRSTTPLQLDSDRAAGTLLKPQNAAEEVTPVETIPLNGSEQVPWSHHWTNLPKYDESGNPYYYYVEEVDGTNYDASYEYTFSNNDGEPKVIKQVTITNTKKSQGITLPATGSKYPWIFYGLGWTFLLLSMLWMFLVLKKQNIKNNMGKGGKT